MNTDPYHLNRFVIAQQQHFAQALHEIHQGKKQSHWMWFIFPQIDGLAESETAKMYAIKTIEEAKAYLNHPILGLRLEEATKAVLKVKNRSAREIFGTPDDLKLCSSATLFAKLCPEDSVFHKLIDKYYASQHDDKTLSLLKALKSTESI